ncbi:MAG: DNA topoisomerase 3 [Alphaproteobacteria bacterium]|nr:DNA topoisomerase 3 [Alphaproteobacteria bacterium]
MKVVLTEKPSVARDLARVLGLGREQQGCIRGDGLVLTWCLGHLLELEEPAHYDEAWKRWSLDALPMTPARFALRVRADAEGQWKVVRHWLTHPDTAVIVNACDAGREGELIFRQAYQHAGARAPVERLWISSLTAEAIRQGWARLRPGTEFDPLGDAARCRSEADWLVGMNATRALTCRTRDAGGDALWSVGRVQTPTLAMIVARDREIEAFVPEDFWRVEAALEASGGAWTGTWFRRDKPDASAPKDEVPHEERLGDEASALALVAALQGRQGVVASSERKTRTEPPPLLYDLTSLQRRANQRYGMSAQRTLEVAQALYERHKLLTYPRTDARHLTTDQVGTLPGVVAAVAELDVYAPHARPLLDAPLRISKRLVDDAEVGDHHAILPTDTPPTRARLSPDEKRIYDLVARRLLAALSPDAVIDTAEIVVEVHTDAPLPDTVPAPPTLRAKGRVVREAGWQAVDPPKSSKQVLLPDVGPGDPVQVVGAEPKAGRTKPPRPHDDASLLAGMETAGRQLDDRELARALRSAGLGTPATRAAILQTLLDRAYVERDGKTLRATETGRALVDAVPLDELKSAELTGRWEARLARIADGAEARPGFMDDVVAYTGRVVDALRGGELPEAALVRTRPEPDALGACPACGAPVRQRGPVWTCDTGRSCPFVVFSTMSTRAISARMVKQLLADGRTQVVKGFKSRQGKAFEAALLVREDGSVGFAFPDDPPAADAAPPAPPAPPREGDACPACGQGRVLRGRTRLGCSRWREGCTWRGPELVAEEVRP